MCVFFVILPNLDRHPSSFVFVTPEGMVGAKLDDGLRRNDDVLILSSIELWTKFSTDLYQILSKLPADVVKTPPNSEKTFNALLWVKATFVRDLKLEDWRPMLGHSAPNQTSVLMRYIRSGPHCSKVWKIQYGGF